MRVLSVIFMVASASIVFALGLAHLVLTFRSGKLDPRDPELRVRMREVSPVLTRQTTMWKAWVGFNGSHSFGAMLYGLLYGYLALAHGDLLFDSPYLLAVGFSLLAGYILLARRYWFKTPFRGVVLATVLYLAALVASWSSPG